MRYTFIILLFTISVFVFVESGHSHSYTWLDKYEEPDAIVNRITPPRGYERIGLTSNCFGDWLRHLPLKQQNQAVYLYNGSKKRKQDVHFAVVDIDTGKRDLQQCADAIMRLRAEYLYSIGGYDRIHFNFTSGDRADFSKWAEGYRPVIKGNKVSWGKPKSVDFSYTNFRKYLDIIFIYAGSYSLSRELHKVQDISEIRIGDVYIQGGFPGHAVIVIDMVTSRETGEKLFLLGQSYMPAQDIHILKNPNNSELSPWYKLDFGEALYTPEWTFKASDLKRFDDH